MMMQVPGFSVLGTVQPTCQINFMGCMTAFFYLFCYCNRFFPVLSLKLFYHMSDHSVSYRTYFHRQ